MLVRIRSKDGNFRFELNPSDDISVLVSKILETSPTIDLATLALSNAPRGGENLVSTITGNLQSLGLNHGVLLFASYTPLAAIAVDSAPAPTASTSSTLSGKVVPSVAAPAAATTVATTPNSKKPWESVEEDPVDVYWEGKDGKIPRKKGENGCRCGPKQMCDYCMPLEPFDSTYQSTHAIKHLSYHSYLRQLHASLPPSSSSTSYIPPLQDPSYTVQVPCSSGSHPSWPLGICTKCQPSPITLSRQTYRMVDHIEFASPGIIESFLGYWRKTGLQRVGWLLGKFEKYEEVPMGIKVVVEAVHEPRQEGHADGVTLEVPWAEEEAKVEQLAKDCGLQVVGVIYTDLTAVKEGKGKDEGKVESKRHANSFFLSSLEIIFSATLQLSHQTPSRFSTSGKFSSRFTTCVLSGNVEGDVAVEAYQVSDQAMAMVQADMVEASVDPGTMRVKEEGADRYIPDVFFRYKNSYGIEVKESAKPCFPVEYLLVNVTYGFPKTPNPLFVSPTPFATENRSPLLITQSISQVATSFSKIGNEVLKPDLVTIVGDPDLIKSGQAVGKWLSDWHLLKFLEGTGLFAEEDVKLMAQLATSINSNNSPPLELVKKLLLSSSWQTFLAVVESETPQPQTNGGNQQSFSDGFEIPPDVDVPPGGDDVDMDDAHGGGGGGGGGGGAVACPHCTFENEPGVTDCDVCGLPLN